MRLRIGGLEFKGLAIGGRSPLIFMALHHALGELDVCRGTLWILALGPDLLSLLALANVPVQVAQPRARITALACFASAAVAVRTEPGAAAGSTRACAAGLLLGECDGFLVKRYQNIGRGNSFEPLDALT